MAHQLRLLHLFRKTIRVMLTALFIWQSENDSEIYKISYMIPLSLWLMTSLKLLHGCFNVKNSSALARAAISAVAFPSTLTKVKILLMVMIAKNSEINNNFFQNS